MTLITEIPVNSPKDPPISDTLSKKVARTSRTTVGKFSSPNLISTVAMFSILVWITSDSLTEDCLAKLMSSWPLLLAKMVLNSKLFSRGRRFKKIKFFSVGKRLVDCILLSLYWISLQGGMHLWSFCDVLIIDPSLFINLRLSIQLQLARVAEFMPRSIAKDGLQEFFCPTYFSTVDFNMHPVTLKMWLQDLFHVIRLENKSPTSLLPELFLRYILSGGFRGCCTYQSRQTWKLGSQEHDVFPVLRKLALN